MDVITLTDDEEDSKNHKAPLVGQRNGSMFSSARSNSASATAHVGMGRPLNLNALFEQGGGTTRGQLPLLQAPRRVGNATTIQQPQQHVSPLLHSGSSGGMLVDGGGSRAAATGAVLNGVGHAAQPPPPNRVLVPRPPVHLLAPLKQQPVTSASLSPNSTLQPPTAKRPRIDEPQRAAMQQAQTQAHMAKAQKLLASRYASLPAISGQDSNEKGSVYRDVNSVASLNMKLHQFGNTYLETFDSKQNPCDEEFAGQFKCTYNGCNKLLSNNVTFMMHLWAHASRLNSFTVEEDVTNLHLANTGRQDSQSYEQKHDVDRMRTCPECLIMQPSPHRMQLHYHRVHKRTPSFESPDLTICLICEIVLRKATEHVVPHFQRHGQFDTPYACKKCRYRSSSREALLNHFMENHAGTSIVLCPFCLTSFNIPYGDRQRRTVLMKPFVQHIFDHEAYVQHTCHLCAIRFIPADQHTIQQRMLTHKKVHIKADPKWKYERKKIHSLRKFYSKAVSWSVGFPRKCVECEHVINSGRGSKQIEKHFKEHWKCGLPNCNYETCCPNARELHEVLAPCQIALRKLSGRWPFGKPKSIVNVKETAEGLISSAKDGDFPIKQLNCTGCGFSTTDGMSMSKHLGTKLECSEATVVGANQTGGRGGQERGEEEKIELDCLGIRSAYGAKQVLPEKLGKKATAPNALAFTTSGRTHAKPADEAEALSAILPLARVTHVRQNRSMVKYLTCDPVPEGSGGADKEFRELVSHFRCLMVPDDVEGLCKCFHSAQEAEE